MSWISLERKIGRDPSILLISKNDLTPMFL